MAQTLLFEPIRLRELELPNRIVVSPMCQYSAIDGVANDWHLVHLGKFAQGGAGTIMIEATAVEEIGRITHGDVGLWKDEQIAPLKRITDFMKSNGSVPAIQLGHAGRKGSMQRPWFGNGPLTNEDTKRGDLEWQTVAAFNKPVDSHWLTPKAASKEDLERIKTAFIAAAKRAIEAGFQIAEVHAAHGYLLHSFLSPLANFREDEYGGSLENRMRFPLEVAKAVRDVWPKEWPVFFRCSAIDDYDGGWEIEDSLVLAKALTKIGIDIIDCSSAGIFDSATGASKNMPRAPRVPGFQVPLAEKIQKETGLKSMAVGLILDGHQAETILKNNQASLIAIGREVLYDPNWALHAALDLGVDHSYDKWPKQYGWWLTRRESMLSKQSIKHTHRIIP